MYLYIYIYINILIDNALSLYGFALLEMLLESGSLPKLEALHIAVCNGKEEGMKHICGALKEHPLYSLKELNVAGNDIRDGGMRILKETLLSNTYQQQMEYLDVSVNNYTANGMNHLLYIITKCDNLKTVRAYGNESTETGLREFPQLVSQKITHSAIENLYFHWITMGNNGCMSICRSIDTGFFSNIKILDLADNYLDDSGITYLAEPIQQKNLYRLQTLDLSRIFYIFCYINR